jgi:hypothetical protein
VKIAGDVYGHPENQGFLNRVWALAVESESDPAWSRRSLMEIARMLTRDKLTDAQWNAIRTAPHLVMLAVSAAGGTPFEEWRERKAGLRGISDAINSSNPLLQAIADSVQIVEAEEEVRAWYYTLPDAERTLSSLQARALGSVRLALDAVRSQGSAEDLVQYGDFILGTAMRVARVAREGDFLGIDGERISGAERDFIARLEDVVKTGRG